jgi:hypothetical protein
LSNLPSPVINLAHQAILRFRSATRRDSVRSRVELSDPVRTFLRKAAKTVTFGSLAFVLGSVGAEAMWHQPWLKLRRP